MSTDTPDAVPPPRRPRFGRKTATAAFAAALLAAGGGWWLLRTPGRPAASPADTLAVAVADADSDDPARRRAAALAALGLIRGEHRDADFPGGPEYVVGLDAFHRAAETAAAGGDAAPLWRAADRYLTEAKRRGVGPARRTRVRYALGVTLAERGRFRDALAPLRSALGNADGGGTGAAFPELLPVLAEAALAAGEPLDREDARRRIDAVAELPAGPLGDRIALARGRLLLADGRPDDAVAAVGGLPRDDPAAARLRAEGGLAAGRPDEAAAAIAALPDDGDPAATLLRARVSEARGNADAALRTYRRAAARGDPVATLSVGRLLAAAGRLEEATAAIGGGLRSHAASGRDPTPEVAAATRAALDAVGRADADLCADLCAVAAPVIGATDAARLRLAVLSRRLERDGTGSILNPGTERARRLREAADAAAAYAETLTDPADRRSARLSAARLFRDAGAARDALRELDLVLAEPPDRETPAALLLRGNLHLDGGDAAAAEADADRILADFAADPAVPAAAVLGGRCRLERDDPAGAEAAWRAVLADPRLAPAAAEWRDALFHLAVLLHDRVVAAGDAGTAARRAAGAAAAADRLGEFLLREPSGARASEARFRRAVMRATRAAAVGERPAGESLRNRNARIARRDALFDGAVDDYRVTRDELVAAGERHPLDPPDAARLAACDRGIAACLRVLDRPGAAAVAAGEAINRDPISVPALVNYLDLAELARARGDADAARTVLEQARLTLARLGEEDLDGGGSALSRAGWAKVLSAAADPPADSPGTSSPP